MRRVLIVEESDILVRVITKDCLPDDRILSCSDGITALRMLTEFRPDVLLINLFLPYKSGFSVLLEATYLPRQIVAFSYAVNPYITQALGLLGVQCVLHMPTAGCIRQALTMIQNMQTGVRADLRQLVTEHLQRLGIPPSIDGYKMLVVGLPLLFRDPAQPLVKELYPAIAHVLDKSSADAVEKSIRKAITKGWECRHDSVWEQYFSRNTKGQIRCPTNKQFLTVLIRRLQQDLEK